MVTPEFAQRVTARGRITAKLSQSVAGEGRTILVGAAGNPVIFLEPDVVQQSHIGRHSAAVGSEGERLGGRELLRATLPGHDAGRGRVIAAAARLPFINLARPGVYGSSGNHLHRPREREVALVNGALDELKVLQEVGVAVQSPTSFGRRAPASAF